MRLSSYFEGAGKVFIYNLRVETTRPALIGDYVMVYRQSIGGRYSPKAFSPTTDRMVRIGPIVQSGENPPGAGSYIRFNSYFRDIREICIYPTLEPGLLLDQKARDAHRSGRETFMGEEAGVRVATGPEGCRTFCAEDYVDARPQARDDHLENLVKGGDAMHAKGSVISFGMVVAQDNSNGYEFCQLELAAVNGDDRMLVVCIKIPRDRKLSSNYIKEQTLLPHMDSFIEENFLEVDNGSFIVKEYGESSEQRNRTVAPWRHLSSTLVLGHEELKILYLELVSAASAKNDGCRRFNPGVIEEWRNSLPSETISRHMQNLFLLYTQEVQDIIAELNQWRMTVDGGAMMATIDDQYEDLKGISTDIDTMRLDLFMLREGQQYVSDRMKAIEFERRKEEFFAAKKRNAALAAARETIPRPLTPDQTPSGGTTPTNSPRRKRTKAEQDRLDEEASRALSLIIERGKKNGLFKRNTSPVDSEICRRFEAEKNLTQTLLMAMDADDEEENPTQTPLTVMDVDSGADAGSDVGADADEDADEERDDERDSGADAGADADAGEDADDEDSQDTQDCGGVMLWPTEIGSTTETKGHEQQLPVRLSRSRALDDQNSDASSPAKEEESMEDVQLDYKPTNENALGIWTPEEWNALGNESDDSDDAGGTPITTPSPEKQNLSDHDNNKEASGSKAAESA